MDSIQKYEIFVEARNNINYYKGEVLPFIHKVCRKDMTSGDIDGFVWDYRKKIYLLIEQKRTKERHKDSQDLHLKFIEAIFSEMKHSERFSNYKFYVLKIVGDPPFRTSTVINISDNMVKEIDQYTLKDLLEMNVLFEDL